MSPVGVVGLGIMGSAMSQRLIAAGYTVYGFDLDQSRATAHLSRGGHIAEDVRRMAARCPLLITSLPSRDALISTIKNLARTRSAGDLIIVETSTLSVEDKLYARDLLGSAGSLLDCPLSGTGAQAAHGDLVAYVSGPDSAKATAAAVLETFTREQFDLGGFGNGTRMKLVANLLVAVHTVAAAEALTMAERLGLDLDMTVSAVGAGAGHSMMLELRGPMMTHGRYEPTAASIATLVKDVRLIDAQRSQLGMAHGLTTEARLVFEAALRSGLGPVDAAGVFDVVRRQGKPVRPRSEGR